MQSNTSIFARDFADRFVNLSNWRAALLAALLAVVALGVPAALAEAKGPTLTLMETVPDNVGNDTRWTVTAGSVTQKSAYGDYSSVSTWSAPPATMDGNGFDWTLTIQADATPNTITSGTGASQTGGFNFDLDPPQTPQVTAPQGGSKSESVKVHVTPDPNVAEGSILELRVGTFWSYGVTYRYKVTKGAATTTGGTGNGTNGQSSTLAAAFDCPSSIVISAPDLNCHLSVSGFRHDTSDPVEVILPSAVDSFGNHASGIQLDQLAATQDPYNMDDPYSWGFFAFACASRPNQAHNCYANAAAPGTADVPVMVKQGEDVLNVMLSFTVLPPSSKPTTTTTLQPGGNSNLSATVACPGTIVISAPDLNCHLSITGFRHNTADPIDVSAIDAIDEFGNHDNGIQLDQLSGEQDVFEMDDPASWGFFAFACASRPNQAHNCYSSAATPGTTATIPVLITQGPDEFRLNLTFGVLPPG